MAENSWEYEDFEFDNRVTNLMWTICGNYGEEMNQTEKTDLSQNIALYFGIMAGGRRKCIDWLLVDRYVGWRKAQGFNAERLQRMLYLAANETAVNHLILERPGVADIRRQACGEMVSILGQPVSKNLLDRVEFALYQRRGGLSSYDEEAGDFAGALTGIAQAENTEQLLEGVDRLYTEWFRPEHATGFSVEAILKAGNQQGFNTESFIKQAVEALLAQDGFRGECGEENADNRDIARTKTMYIDGDQLENMAQKVNEVCGLSYLNAYTLRRLENRLCKGPHQDCRLHYTDGLIRAGGGMLTRVGLAQKVRKKNREAYYEKLPVYERTIKRLRDSIFQTLQDERAKYFVSADTGSIDVPKLWQVGRVPCSRLFKKTESNDKGGYVVDLLIDSSFSQKGRDSRVAIQAYIIARALVEAGIPCRVNGFYCYLDFTVLKRYRDFDDPVRETENLFEYDCEGSNRDGLAIKGVCDGLCRREEENKILIVLSDGKPNDLHLVNKETVQTFRGQTAYSGGAAIGDTAKEVRIARQRGVLVLGIFTGNERDLPAEKLIYGKDFIYTREVRHFADIVAAYLKRIIRS